MSDAKIIAAIAAEMAAHENEILGALRDAAAMLTGEVAFQVEFRYGLNPRMHGHYVRKLLLDLEKRGLVKRLDDEKPVCWMLDAKETKNG